MNGGLPVTDELRLGPGVWHSAVLVEMMPQLVDRGEAHGAARQLGFDGAVGEEGVGHLVDYSRFQDRDRARLRAQRLGTRRLHTNRVGTDRLLANRLGADGIGTLRGVRRAGTLLGP